VTSILSAVSGFYEVFYSCFKYYVDFELEMTRTIASLPPGVLFMLFTLVLLVVNSALFWAWKLVKALLPWGHGPWSKMLRRMALDTEDDDFDKLL